MLADETRKDSEHSQTEKHSRSDEIESTKHPGILQVNSSLEKGALVQKENTVGFAAVNKSSLSPQSLLQQKQDIMAFRSDAPASTSDKAMLSFVVREKFGPFSDSIDGIDLRPFRDEIPGLVLKPQLSKSKSHKSAIVRALIKLINRWSR